MVLAACATPAGAQRWQMQYFYDKNKSTLAISDFSFASAMRGIAVGAIVEGKSHKSVAVVTSDGGTVSDAGTNTLSVQPLAN